MADEQKVGPEKQPKDRSPSFPYIGLSKAFERTEQLYGYAKRFESRIADCAKPAWNLGAKSSGTLQTVAALLAYGLIEDSGSGDNRKVKISELAYRALVDQRPGAKEAALAEAAVKPKLLAEYIDKWGQEQPPEANCLSELTLDRGFTPDGAKAFLRVFADTVRYAKPGVSDTESDTSGEKLSEVEPSNQPIAVGDWVRVETGGQIVFEKTRVRQIDGPWVFVEASQSGAKMSDVTLLEKAAVEEKPPVLPFAPPADAKPAAGEEMDRFTVDEGVVKITFPSGMTSDSVEELEQFFNLFIKKAKRRAGAEKA